MSTALYPDAEPPRSEIDASAGPLLIQFGAPWCGHCQGAQPLIQAALAGHPQLRHLRIEDGRGRPLGRSFKVTLWPTLVFLRDGSEVARVVRPQAAGEITEALAAL